jgi:hypothetical protein
MKKLVHPHCNIVVNIDPIREEIIDRNYRKAPGIRGLLNAREEISDRHEKWMKWLINQNYNLGQHYFRCEEGYRFSSDNIAKEFILGALK